ncbi:hypothetical protein ACCO45_004096 [Purpureocillium lilacinum]|uniref:Uncharacterized protein n=1 Tax=Purpureocillium lilacinum TaxID=33203 RepID=A0ACC4E4X2_PURLI
MDAHFRFAGAGRRGWSRLLAGARWRHRHPNAPRPLLPHGAPCLRAPSAHHCRPTPTAMARDAVTPTPTTTRRASSLLDAGFLHCTTRRAELVPPTSIMMAATRTHTPTDARPGQRERQPTFTET